MLKKINLAITYCYLFLMFAIYPVAFYGGYIGLADFKFGIFLYSGIAVCVILTIALIESVFLDQEKAMKKTGKRTLAVKKDNKQTGGMSILDWSVILYAISITLSYFNSAEKELAWIGSDGWFMGYRTQLLLCALYFVISRAVAITKPLDKKRGVVLAYVIGYLFFIITGIGLLQKAGIDFAGWYADSSFDFEGEFFTTLGQISWYAGYIAIAMTWIMYLCVISLKKTTEQDVSLYQKVAVILLLIYSVVVAAVLGEQVLIGTVLVSIAGYGWIVWTSTGKYIHGRNIVYAIGVLVAVTAVVFVIINTVALEAPYKGMGGLFYFDNFWGNQRGVIWKNAFLSYKRMTFGMKLFGIGPDSFYLAMSWADSNELISHFALAKVECAHNEWLNMLICSGFAGLVSYVGIFVCAIRRFYKEALNNNFDMFITVCILVYIFYGFFCYQTYYNTVWMFLIMAVGEGKKREV